MNDGLENIWKEADISLEGLSKNHGKPSFWIAAVSAQKYKLTALPTH
jgi:hypothetical protein